MDEPHAILAGGLDSAGVVPMGLVSLAEPPSIDAGPPSSLDAWQHLFASVFAVRNAFMSPELIWLRVIEQAGQLAEALRKEDYRSFEDDIISDLLAWLFAFANKVGIVLSEAVWDKYPGLCPYCAPPDEEAPSLIANGTVRSYGNVDVFVVRSCTCGQVDYPPYSPQRVATIRAHPEGKPRTLAEWQALFAGIYGAAHRQTRGADAVAYHLLEEIAEVAKEIRLGRFREAQEEVADVFSWILCLATRVGFLLVDRQPIQAEAVFWRTYPGCCKACQQSVCTC